MPHNTAMSYLIMQTNNVNLVKLMVELFTLLVSDATIIKIQSLAALLTGFANASFIAAEWPSRDLLYWKDSAHWRSS